MGVSTPPESRLGSRYSLQTACTEENMPWQEFIKDGKVNENGSAVARVFLTACPRARLEMKCPSRLGTLPTPPGTKKTYTTNML